MDQHPAPDVAIDLDETARQSRLALHLTRLTRRHGARVEEHGTFRAVVVMERPRPSMVPNVLLAAVGVACFLAFGGLFFLLGAGLALLGWHRKLVAAVERVRILVRIDERGQVSEFELGAVEAA